MYDEGVTAAALEKIEAGLDIRLTRYTPAESHELTTELTRLKEAGKLFTPSGAFNNKDHANFVKNERILFQQDFLYATRYITIEKDGMEGGGVGYLADTFWESQRILIDLVAKLERVNVDHHQRGYPCDGIKICDNKGGRQLGHTRVARAMTIHRLVAHPYSRCMAASVDEPKKLLVYNVDKIMLDGLPFFLLPTGWPDEGYDKKGEHIQFPDAHGSKILYQHGNQESGIGTGSQFDVSHLTELSEWPYADQLALDFFPTLPQNPYTFSLMETTPKGRKNWWFTWSESVRKGEIAGWAYLYIPFYAEPKKYRRHPPEGWVPNDNTMQLAWKVNQTSQEFVGKQITLAREQMYWWETSYNDAIAGNELNKFLSNYSVTPEMSFQHTSASAINPQTLDWMRQTSNMPALYDVQGL